MNTANRNVFAHSVPGKAKVVWEKLHSHLHEVAKRSGNFAASFGWDAHARLAGLLHDLGKCSAAFQRYIEADGAGRGPDHSTAGAREAIRLYGTSGTLLAFIIAGHHAGLADAADLDRRLTKPLEPYDGWEAHTGPLPATAAALAPTRTPCLNAERGFTHQFLIRMLFSCLVDADRLATAAFYARAAGQDEERAEGTPLPVLRSRLAKFMATKNTNAQPLARSGHERRLGALRADVLGGAIEKAALSPGLFTLTVPTGGGKTLASLSFALEHAVTHGLHRIVYVIPFTSVAEQSAQVFRTALAADPDQLNDSDILEHVASFDWDEALRRTRGGSEDGRGSEAIERLQRAAENWDVPVVVTTAVQFFESLFASSPSACRKLHNLAQSVVVLDEAQTLPRHILRPCLAALDELARNYGTSIVICTATQPAWRKLDEKLVERQSGGRPARNFGLDIPLEREIAPDPKRLFAALKRVEVDYRPDPIDDAVLAERFAEVPQMLCIVNSRRHAKRLFGMVEDLDGAIHLSTWMCPRHRRLVLEQARTDLLAGNPVRIVSTSLIEAGVDIDFPEVWRAATGLESCLQAAGRCNREFRTPLGKLVIFVPLDDKPPHDLKQSWEAGRTVLRRHADPQTLDAVLDYFGELYFNKGTEAFDASKLDRALWPILSHISERSTDMAFPFASIAQAFKVIEDTMQPVIVPWSSGPNDREAASALNRIAAMDRPLRADLRRLQQYTVSIPERQRKAWLDAGVLQPVHPVIGETLLCFPDLSLYDDRSGLRVDEPDHRSAEKNIV